MVRAGRPEVLEVPSHMGASVAQQLVADYVEWPKCIAEVVKNANDARFQIEPAKPLEETHITIRYVRAGDDVNVEVVDNVSGGNIAAWSAIVSIAHSADAAFTKSGRSKRVGQYDTGRLANLNHCERLTYEMLPGDGRLRSVSFNFDELMAMTRAGKGQWGVQTLPRGHVLQKRGTRLILHGLGKGTKDEKHDRSAARLVRELAEHIPYELVPRVRVIDLEGVEFPLAEREVIGDPIRMTLKGEHCGMVIVNIGIAQRAQGVAGSVKLTTWGSGPTFTEFFRPIVRDRRYAELVEQLRYLLTHAQAMGSVEIPEGKEYRAPGSSSFTAGLYGNQRFVTELLTLLITSVVPEMQKRIGSSNTELKPRSTEASLLAEAVRRVHEVTGVVPKGTTKVPAGPSTDRHRARFAVNTGPHIIELDPLLSQGKDPKKLVWDTRRCGGDVDTTTGPRIEYTPRVLSASGSPHVLICRDLTRSGGPDEQVIYTLYIQVLSELPLECAPATMTLLPGDRALIRLVNMDHCSGRFLWSVAGEGVTLEAHADTRTAHVTATDIGEYDVRVEDAADPSKSTVCVVRCVDQRNVPSGGQTPQDNEFTWNGHRFVVDLMSYPSDAMYGILWTLDAGDAHSVLNVNTGHPAMRTARSDEVRLSVYLSCIASGIAKHLCAGRTFEEYDEQKARVLAALSIPKDVEKAKK